MSEKGQAMRIWKFEGADLDALRYALLRDDDDVPTSVSYTHLTLPTKRIV